MNTATELRQHEIWIEELKNEMKRLRDGIRVIRNEVRKLRETILLTPEAFNDIKNRTVDDYRCGRCGSYAEGGCCSQAPPFKRCSNCGKFNEYSLDCDDC